MNSYLFETLTAIRNGLSENAAANSSAQGHIADLQAPINPFRLFTSSHILI